MHTFFCLYISEFTGNLEGMIDDRKYRTKLKNIYKLGVKAQYLNSADVLMLGNGCEVSQYPQFYDTD